MDGCGVLVLTENQNKICYFEIRSSNDVLIDSVASDYKGDDSPDFLDGKGTKRRKNHGLSKFIGNVFRRSATIDIDFDGSPTPSDDPPNNQPCAWPIVNAKCESALFSYCHLPQREAMARELSLAAVLKFPLRVKSIVPIDRFCDAKWINPVLFGLADHPVIAVMDAEGDRGVKSSVHLYKLAVACASEFINIGDISPPSPHNNQLLCSSISIYTPESRQPCYSMAEYLGGNVPESRLVSFDRNDAYRPEAGVQQLILAYSVNAIIVALSDGMSLLLRYKTDHSQIMSKNSKLLPISTRQKIGRLLSHRGTPLLSLRLASSRKELIVLLKDGITLTIDLSSWLTRGMEVKTLYDLSKVSPLGRRLTSAVANANNNAVAYTFSVDSTEGRNSRQSHGVLIIDRQGGEIISLSAAKPCLACCWTKWDRILIVADGNKLHVIHLLSDARTQYDMGICCSQPSRRKALLAPLRLVLFDGDKLNYSHSHEFPWVINDCGKIREVDALSFQLNPSGSRGLLATTGTIFLANFNPIDRTKTTWGDLFEDKSSDLSQQFPFKSNLPLGWLTDNILFYTSRIGVSGTRHKLYLICFLQVYDNPTGTQFLKPIGITKPVTMRPVRTTVLGEDSRWTRSCETDKSGHAYQYMNQLFTAQGVAFAFKGKKEIQSFKYPPFGVYYENESFVCYRAHTSGLACRTSDKCSRHVLKNPTGYAWDNVNTCFESMYVCRTDLGQPLEISFVADPFTLLIRDYYGLLRIAHVCSTVSQPANILSLLQPKTLSFSSTHLVCSPPLLLEPVLSIAPFAKSESQFQRRPDADVWSFNYTFRTKDDEVVPLTIESLDNIRGEQEKAHSTSDFQSGSVASRSESDLEEGSINGKHPTPENRQRHSEGPTLDGDISCSILHGRVRRHSDHCDNSELLSASPGWNFVSGTLGGRAFGDASKSESSALSVGVTSATPPHMEDEDDIESIVHLNEQPRTNSFSRLFSDEIPNGENSEFVQKVESAVQGHFNDQLGECLKQQVKDISMNSSGGLDLLIATGTMTYLLKISIFVHQFAPPSRIIRHGSFPTTTSPVNPFSLLSEWGLQATDCSSSSFKLWTLNYAVSIEALNPANSEYRPIAIVSSSKVTNVAQFITTVRQTLDKEPWNWTLHQYATNTIPTITADLALLSRSREELSFQMLGLPERLNRIIHLVGDSVPDASRLERALGDVLMANLDAAVKLIKSTTAGLSATKSGLECSPAVHDIQRALMKCLNKDPVLSLFATIHFLRNLLADDLKVIIKMARLFEPLISPFILFPLRGQTMASIFDELIQKNKLRSAMALLVPLQQVYGPRDCRIDFATKLLFHALIHEDKPLVLDLVSFIRHRGHKEPLDLPSNPISYLRRLPERMNQMNSSENDPVEIELVNSIHNAIMTLLNSFAWHKVVSAIVVLHLNVLVWFRSLPAKFKESWKPSIGVDRVRYVAMVESIRKAFFINDRRLHCKANNMNLFSFAGSREIIIGDWALKILLVAAVSGDLHLLTVAINTLPGVDERLNPLLRH